MKESVNKTKNRDKLSAAKGSVFVKILNTGALNWTSNQLFSFEQKVHRVWLQRSMKAFQDLTAKKMSSFVTLCARTRLQCRTPKSAPRRLHSNTTGSTPPPRDGAGAGGRLKAFWHLRSKVTRRAASSHRGCQAGQPATSLLPWLYFWGFVMKVSPLSHPL